MANPKSANLGTPFDIRILAGLMSRWMISIGYIVLFVTLLLQCLHSTEDLPEQLKGLLLVEFLVLVNEVS